MRIQVGKTYVTRDGHKVTIEAETPMATATYVMQGVDERGRITWRTRKGRFDRHPHPNDLVSESE